MFRAVISEGLALLVALALSRHSIGHVGACYTVLRRPRAVFVFVFVFACKLLPLSKVTSMVELCSSPLLFARSPTLARFRLCELFPMLNGEERRGSAQIYHALHWLSSILPSSITISLAVQRKGTTSKYEGTYLPTYLPT
jgi:hypothetical protein